MRSTKAKLSAKRPTLSLGKPDTVDHYRTAVARQAQVPQDPPVLPPAPGAMPNQHPKRMIESADHAKTLAKMLAYFQPPR